MRVSFRDIEFNIVSFFGPYQSEYFERFNKHEVEPDTVGFLENVLDKNCLFIDIGASVGTFSLLAASLRSHVVAYEPMSEEVDSARRNLEANPKLERLISLKSVAVTSRRNLEVNVKNNYAKILTPIVRGEKYQYFNVEVAPIEDEIDFWISMARTNNLKIVLKMDIEGAEWPMLLDRNVLESIKKTSGLALVALHPGGHRPFVIGRPYFRKVRHLIFRFRNWKDAKSLYFLASEIGVKIKKLDGTVISHSRIFARLLDAGYYEFIFDFNGSKTI